jgi:uncharacterized membrane protein
MIYLILSTMAFSISSLFYKMASTRNCRPLGLNFSLFLSVTMILLIYILATRSPFRSAPVLIGAFGGISVLITSVYFFLAVHHGGKLSVCWTVLSLSFIIPTLASILVWNEALSVKRGAGLLLIVLSLFLLGGETE